LLAGWNGEEWAVRCQKRKGLGTSGPFEAQDKLKAGRQKGWRGKSRGAQTQAPRATGGRNVVRGVPGPLAGKLTPR